MKNNPHIRIDAQNIIIERSERLTTHLQGALQIYHTRENLTGVKDMETRLAYENKLREAAWSKKKEIISAIHYMLTTSDDPIMTLESLGYTNKGWSNSWSLKQRQEVRSHCGHNMSYKSFAASPNTEWSFCHECKFYYRSDAS